MTALPIRNGLEVLTTTDMAEVDRLAVVQGVPSLALMEVAGSAVAKAAADMVPVGAEILVLCGPGNNGGDGFVAARLLVEAGYDVVIGMLADRAALKGDAAAMARAWTGPVAPPDGWIGRADLIIDALLGAGLSRDIDGGYAALIDAVNASRRPVLAVDVPSGLDGNTGQPRPRAIQATRTVTFHRRKPGHLLLPGRALCGAVTVADIGIPAAILDGSQAPLGERLHCNGPGLWWHAYPMPTASGHKYNRGHAVVVSGPPECTGAARLGARGAHRAGAGLVTVATSRAAFPINAVHLTAIMLQAFEVPAGLAKVLADTRRNAVLIGPGAGVTTATREMVQLALASGAATILDADALTSFAAEAVVDDDAPSPFGFLRPAVAGATSHPQDLFAEIARRPDRAVVLTPHEGEFQRLFGRVQGSKLERARMAAEMSGAVIVLKGADTVIAAPDGRAAINDTAPPWLATAGSGDVLAGFVTGLLAQGMPAYEAACAAVWLHGACATAFGPGLIAEDIPEQLPRVLAGLMADASGA